MDFSAYHKLSPLRLISCSKTAYSYVQAQATISSSASLYFHERKIPDLLLHQAMCNTPAITGS